VAGVRGHRLHSGPAFKDEQDLVSVRPLLLFGLGAALTGARPTPSPIGSFEYRLTFNRITAATRSVGVVTSFTAAAAGPVELSLPAWTPGAYEISNFARKVVGFAATQGNAPLRWDKTDQDTWRIQVAAPGRVTLTFRAVADSLDNAMAWARPDFVFLNGTNVFLYAEGSDLGFGATVIVETEPDWRVATGMNQVGPGRYDARDFHELVDMPVFVGRLDVDSAQIEGRWHRVASYPAGILAGTSRQVLWSQLKAMVPAMTRVFGETPWPHYSTLLVFDSSYGGGSALEHQNSHVGIYNPGFIGTALLASITAHEIFHAWNVKRLRPSELVPYRYDRVQPTTLLWVSEGITDYYADLALLRGGIIDSTLFLNLTNGKIEEVSQLPPVALEDASLSTWIQPVDGTGTIYYPKGSLAGFLLDILIRDASDNRGSLDDVLRALYQSTYRAGKGFSVEDWWRQVAATAGKDGFASFAERYIDGREPFPWREVAPLAGLRVVADSVREVRLGVGTTSVENREIVTSVVPNSAAAEAGVQPGDELISIGDLKIDADFGPAFRIRYGRRIGERVPMVVNRGGQTVNLTVTLRGEVRVEERLEFERRATLKAGRIRTGLLKGVTDRP
jgi:predicted metalloprotease with PDZ domain